jgi:hypothetical protein
MGSKKVGNPELVANRHLFSAFFQENKKMLFI